MSATVTVVASQFVLAFVFFGAVTLPLSDRFKGTPHAEFGLEKILNFLSMDANSFNRFDYCGIG